MPQITTRLTDPKDIFASLLVENSNSHAIRFNNRVGDSRAILSLYRASETVKVAVRGAPICPIGGLGGLIGGESQTCFHKLQP
jgi:hypothetical protein